MQRSDVIFGEPVENAPPRRHVDPNTPVIIPMPGEWDDLPPMPFHEAQRLHHDLGQTLARMMRRRGSATPPDDPVGGTPVAMRLAA